MPQAPRAAPSTAPRAAPSTAPHAAPSPGHRVAATLGLLIAVLLAVLPPVAPFGPAPGTATAGAQVPDSDHRVDAPCAAGCAAQVRAVRHEHLAERPAPLDHFATAPRAGAADPSAGTRTPAHRAFPPDSPDRPDRHRGRAPPADVSS
ncbi:hypothetical protein ACIQNG_09505 [Streptomyces sp. NPDC091377]|uniref:hypothetical protein n=1 Tax=Streptomyces sp. NPDC091377 TaxID=3365995 RepID=UPI0038128A1A